MKPFLAALFVFLLMVGTVVGYGVWQKRGIQVLDESALQGWTKVVEAYEKRALLIPVLLEDMQNYKVADKALVDKVRAALHATDTIKKDGEVVSSYQRFQAFVKAQKDLGNTVRALFEGLQSAPGFKEGDNLKVLREKLAGADEGIAEATKQFNQEARVYNKKVLKFPTAIIAMIYNFERKLTFETAKK